MMAHMRLVLLLLFMAVFSVRSWPEEPNPNLNDLDAIPPELQTKIREVGMAFSLGKYSDALSKIDEADKTFPHSAVIHNLRGAIYVKQRDFPKATEQFNKALEAKANYFDARFNLSEILFLEKKYAEARKAFQKLADDTTIKSDPSQQKLWRDVVSYKIFLTYLLENNEAEAQKILQKIDPYAETPIYYFTNAAWEYQHKQNTKAEGWIRSSLTIFSPQTNDLFADSLVEIGWIPKSAPASPAP